MPSAIRSDAAPLYNPFRDSAGSLIRIVRARHELHRGLNQPVVAASPHRRCDVVRSAALPGSSRTMYQARRIA